MARTCTSRPRRSRTRSASSALAPVVGTVAVLVVAVLAGACSSGGGSAGGSPVGSPVVRAVDLPPCPVEALPAPGERRRLTVWHPYTGLTTETLEALAADYNARQDRVEVVVQGQGTALELHRKYLDALGDPASLPDLVFTEDTYLRFLSDSGSVVPAESCIAADPAGAPFAGELLAPVDAAYRVDGALWPGGFGVSTLMLYANDAQRRAAGVPTATTPATLAELRAEAERVQAAALPGVVAPVVMQLDPWLVDTALTGAGVPVVDADNGRAGVAGEALLESPEAVGVFAWVRDMVVDGLLLPIPFGGGIDDFLALAEGKATYLIAGSRSISTLASVMDGQADGAAAAGVDAATATGVGGLDLAVGPVPGLAAAGRTGVSGTAAYVVAGSDADVAGSWDFLRFFNEQPQQVRWTLQGSYLPVTAEVAAAPEVVTAASTTRAGAWLAVVGGGLAELDASFPGPLIGPYNEYRDAVARGLDRVATGADPAAAAGDADAEVTALLQRYRAEVGG